MNLALVLLVLLIQQLVDLKLFDKDVKQFVVPLFGGFDGLNIKYKEPFKLR